jgi:glutaredoxin 1
MEFIAPVSSGFTVYGRSGCSYCEKVKKVLNDFEVEYTYVNCDPYLKDKEAFLAFIETLAGQEHRTFPMVFSTTTFIGGYTDTYKFLLEHIIK